MANEDDLQMRCWRCDRVILELHPYWRGEDNAIYCSTECRDAAREEDQKS